MSCDELVKALRICSSELNCGDCPLLYRDSCSSDELMADAAAAIEALQAELDQWKAAVKGQEDGIKVLQAEVERLKADVDDAYAH